MNKKEQIKKIIMNHAFVGGFLENVKGTDLTKLVEEMARLISEPTPDSGSKPLDGVKAEFYKKMQYFASGKNSEKIKGFWRDEESLDNDAVWDFFLPYLSEGGHNEVESKKTGLVFKIPKGYDTLILRDMNGNIIEETPTKVSEEQKGNL
jgi:hypothetical protein